MSLKTKRKLDQAENNLFNKLKTRDKSTRLPTTKIWNKRSYWQ